MDVTAVRTTTQQLTIDDLDFEADMNDIIGHVSPASPPEVESGESDERD